MKPLTGIIAFTIIVVVLMTMRSYSRHSTPKETPKDPVDVNKKNGSGVKTIKESGLGSSKMIMILGRNYPETYNDYYYTVSRPEIINNFPLTGGTLNPEDFENIAIRYPEENYYNVDLNREVYPLEVVRREQMTEEMIYRTINPGPNPLRIRPIGYHRGWIPSSTKYQFILVLSIVAILNVLILMKTTRNKPHSITSPYIERFKVNLKNAMKLLGFIDSSTMLIFLTEYLFSKTRRLMLFKNRYIRRRINEPNIRRVTSTRGYITKLRTVTYNHMMNVCVISVIYTTIASLLKFKVPEFEGRTKALWIGGSCFIGAIVILNGLGKLKNYQDNPNYADYLMFNGVGGIYSTIFMITHIIALI